MQQLKHYAPAYFMNPTHQIQVTLYGVGGTGSAVLTCLARMNSTLQAIGHPGIYVIACDPDIVSESNIGRQLFSSSDIGRNKAEVLIERTNRFFGFDWISGVTVNTPNIIISCTDTIKSRIQFESQFLHSKYKGSNELFYWLDFGNNNNAGQAILGSKRIDQQKLKNSVSKLPSIFELFPEMKKQVDDNTPSCSVAEAIRKQDLFVNSTLAQLGCNILWKLLKDNVIDYHGVFMNLETMNVKPIKITNYKKKKQFVNLCKYI